MRLDDTSKVESQGLVFSPKWFKRKGDSVDVSLQIENKSQSPIYIKRNSIQVKAGQKSGDMKNKSGMYSTIEGNPKFMYINTKVIAENIEISPESSFTDLFLFRYDGKLPDSVPLEIVISGIYEGTPEKTGLHRPAVRVPLVSN